MNTDLTLKERMKALQAERDYMLDKDSYILCHIDGRAFSKMIKKRFKLPFDDEFMQMMDDTAAYVCENVQGAKLAYVQSDEISIVITSFKYDIDESISEIKAEIELNKKNNEMYINSKIDMEKNEIESNIAMTNKELSRWLRESPAREYKYTTDHYVYSFHPYEENCADEEVYKGIVIREDYKEWREPLVGGNL